MAFHDEKQYHDKNVLKNPELSPIDLAIIFHTDYEMCSLLKSSTIKCEHNVFYQHLVL